MDVLKLISEVQRRPHLWNSKDPRHSDRTFTAQSWEEIAITLQYPVEILRKKWKGLRDTFRMEIKKHPLHRPEDIVNLSAEQCCSTWPFFRELFFLKEQVLVRHARSLVWYNPTSELGIHPTPQIKTIKPEIDSFFNSDSNLETKFHSTASSSNEQPDEENCKLPMKRMQQVDSEQVDIQHKRVHLVEDSNDNGLCSLALDEDKMFLLSLASDLKKVLPERRMLLKLQIHELVYKFVYSQSDHSSSTTLYSESSVS